MAIDEARLDVFVQQFVADLGAALHATTVVIGDKLGLYRALAHLGPSTAADLAADVGCDTGLVQAWLDAQVVSGYCRHSPQTGAYWLSAEQAAVLADAAGPAFLVGGMRLAAGAAKDEDRVRAAFTNGGGLGWHERHHDVFHGTERLFRPGYAAHLASRWVPTLDGLAEALDGGGSGVDVGWGHGAAAILLAEAHPAAHVDAFDPHRASIDVARKRAAEAGVSGRVRFEVGSAHDFGGAGYDLVCVFNALHAMGDPPAAARHIHEALAPHGAWLLVVPTAGAPEGNGYAVDRLFAAASSVIWAPAARALAGGDPLGGRVPDAALARLATDAGFTRFRRVAHTAFHRIFEARP
jgi:SAM-dependent methyltransferase